MHIYHGFEKASKNALKKLLKMLMSGSNRMATCRSAHTLLANSIDNPSRHILQVIFSPNVIDTPSKHVLGNNLYIKNGIF